MIKNHIKSGSYQSRFFIKKIKEEAVLTSFGSIIDYNPKAIIKPFLLGHKFGNIKQVTKYLNVPFLGL